MEPRSTPSLSLSQRRASLIESNLVQGGEPATANMAPQNIRIPERKETLSQSHPRPLPTPQTKSATAIPHNLLPSAPASPPTPAPSPTPHQRIPSWKTAAEHEDRFLRDARFYFSDLNSEQRQRYLAEILNLCDSRQLSFVHSFVSPRLKKDPFSALPTELCLKVGSLVCLWFAFVLTIVFRSSHSLMTPKPFREPRRFPSDGMNCSTTT